MRSYNWSELLECYRRVGVEDGRVVYVAGNLGLLGPYADGERQVILDAHLRALRTLLGDRGTLVVPTYSFSLCNTDRPFSRENTPSETGVFTEHVRLQSGAVRQRHPFSSVTALGHEAEAICGQCSRHVYGLHTPFARMVERDALFVSAGLPPNRSLSLVHHAEFMMGVPYRYVKEFWHPIDVGGEIRHENFYLLVLYRDCGLERSRHLKKMLEVFRQRERVCDEQIGYGRVTSLSMAAFMRTATDLLAEDIYIWLTHPPENRPYRR